MLFNLENINYRIKGRAIIEKYSLQVEESEALLLLGPSGCGKTSLLNIMAGLLRPTDGEVIFNGTSYASLSERALDRLRAQNFGFVFQKLHLIGHLTVRQNIALAQNKADTQKIDALINDLGLSGKEKQKARDLSVGEAQRVAIARAVANTPKVIFADEPTSALDDTNTQKVMDLIFDQAKKTGATVIAATHDARIKNRFNKVLEMTS